MPPKVIKNTSLQVCVFLCVRLRAWLNGVHAKSQGLPNKGSALFWTISFGKKDISSSISGTTRPPPSLHCADNSIIPTPCESLCLPDLPLLVLPSLLLSVPTTLSDKAPLVPVAEGKVHQSETLIYFSLSKWRLYTTKYTIASLNRAVHSETIMIRPWWWSRCLLSAVNCRTFFILRDNRGGLTFSSYGIQQ